MELEQRVKALEYELKILKNEIQRTLLDIQEQVLVHYNPTLRTEEPSVPEGAVQTAAPGPIHTNGKDKAAVARSIPANNSDAVSLTDLDAPLPKVRKISLNEVRAAHSEIPTQTDEIGRMGKLLDWALNASAQIGVGRLKAVMEVCAQHEVISANVQELLLRIAPLNRRAAPATIGINEPVDLILQLDEILGRPADVEEAVALVEEAKLG